MKRTGNLYIAFVICCCLTLTLAACGQRGPLFLPETEEQTGQSETAAGAEEEAGKNTEESDEETPRT
jgi:predicted small lipoprotein YifL